MSGKRSFHLHIHRQLTATAVGGLASVRPSSLGSLIKRLCEQQTGCCSHNLLPTLATGNLRDVRYDSFSSFTAS